MRIAIERRPSALSGAELVEVVTPRTNTAAIGAAENLLAAISLAEPFGLEIAATSTARWFVARAGSPAMREHLAGQLAVAYPQAEIRPLDVDRYPGLDPARTAPDEQVAACALVLRAPPYLPLRTFRDAEVEAERSPQADPVLGILGALGDLHPGWRALAQLVLRPAPDDWCKGYLRLAVEHPLAAQRVTDRADTSLTSVYALAAALGVGALAFQGYQWYVDGQWLQLGLLAGGAAAGVPGLVWLARRLGERPIYDPRLVQEKVSRVAYLSQVRLAVFAPSGTPGPEVQARLDRLAGTYRQYSLAAGNGLVPRPLELRGRDLRRLAPLPSAGWGAALNTRELAGLWHLPQAQADVPLLERTTARQRAPLPGTVARGCPIGVSTHQGRAVSVSLPVETLGRHLLLVAKTRRGKSSLLLRLARYLMEGQTAGGRPSALVLIDPHRDLAQATLGLVPPARRGDVVYLDVAERERPFGLNLLDVALFADRDKAVANALAIFRREFDRFWGPRMEDAFRYALLTLYEANQAICAAEPNGRARQHTVLDVAPLLVDTAFRRSLVGLVSDPVVGAWWSGYFDRLDRRLQVEIANPVQTKVQRFAGSRAARAIVGQPSSTIDPSAWLRSAAVVIVNTGRGTVGEDTAALVGATLLNLVALQVGEQAALEPRERSAVSLLVDEFHTMPGADYEGILGELAKYGANLVLATQSLARLDALDREQHRALRATVFANLDGLFAFHTSAEDARYLIRELGADVDEQDLVSLGEHQCYVRLSAGGERLPTFSVRLDPPPQSDGRIAALLTASSTALYGRHWSAVEADLRSALARIELSHQNLAEQGQSSTGGKGVTRGAATGGDGKAGQPQAAEQLARNDNRDQRPKRGPRVHQASLFKHVETDSGPANEPPPPAETEAPE